MVPKKKKPKSVLKSTAEMKRLQAREIKEVKAKHKKQLFHLKRGHKAERYMWKHGKWPAWYGRKKR